MIRYCCISVSSPADDEQDDADADVREDDADPDLLGKRVQEAEDTGLLLDRLLDHDADAEGHEGLAEVDHSFTLGGDCHRGDRQIRFLCRNTSRTELEALLTCRQEVPYSHS